MGLSMINHPFGGTPMTMETPDFFVFHFVSKAKSLESLELLGLLDSATFAAFAVAASGRFAPLALVTATLS